MSVRSPGPRGEIRDVAGCSTSREETHFPPHFHWRRAQRDDRRGQFACAAALPRTGKGIVLGAGTLFEWGSELALWVHWLECSVCRRSRLSAASRSLVSAVVVAALCWPLYLNTHVCRSRGCLLALCHCCVWGRSPPETPARGRVSFPVSRLRHPPVRSLVLLFLAHRATVASVKASHLAGGHHWGVP